MGGRVTEGQAGSFADLPQTRTSAPVEPWLHRAVFAVAMVGLATSGFLAWEYARGGTIACPVAGTGCDDVRASDFSAVFGVPVPWLGVAYYTTVAVLEILRLEAERRRHLINLVILALAIVGITASTVFTYLEAYVIGAWCFWCLVSAACTVGLFTLAVLIQTAQRAPGVAHEA
jgi:uncharacterized membrane protein